MADDEKSDDTIVLINQLWDFNKNFFIEDLDVNDKDLIVKHGVTKILKSMIEGLNAAFSDVYFSGYWGLPDYSWMRDGGVGESVGNTYQIHYSEQDESWDGLGDKEPSNDYLFNHPLESLMFKMQYILERRCNLGCKHKTLRFQYFTMPKLIEIITHHRLGMPAKQIVKNYLPDFFYDVDTGKSYPVKRGRPRKKRICSSQASDS